METFSALVAICAGNSPVTGEFPAQMAINAENVSIWWRHHGIMSFYLHVFDSKPNIKQWSISNKTPVERMVFKGILLNSTM